MNIFSRIFFGLESDLIPRKTRQSQYFIGYLIYKADEFCETIVYMRWEGPNEFVSDVRKFESGVNELRSAEGDDATDSSGR